MRDQLVIVFTFLVLILSQVSIFLIFFFICGVFFAALYTSFMQQKLFGIRAFVIIFDVFIFFV